MKRQKRKRWVLTETTSWNPEVKKLLLCRSRIASCTGIMGTSCSYMQKHDITCKAMEDVRREHSEVRSSLAQLNATKRALEQDIAVKETANAEVSAQLEDVKQELNEVEKALQMKRKETISQIKDIWEQVE
jgi:septal ring factor EnvC (AmiA/AmiB activator)